MMHHTNRLILASFIFTMVLLVAACRKDDDPSSPTDDTLDTNACQVLSLSTRSHPRIVNGTACGNLENSPVVRVVLTNFIGVSAFCTGTMITETTVLTAAHCFLNNPVDVFILTGRTVETAREIKAQSWLSHPDFGPDGRKAIKDVAIIRLASNPGLPTVPVMTETGVSDREIVSIFGYGKDENGNFNFQELKSGEMKVADTDGTHIIAKFDGTGSNTCQGDSGGPLLSSRLGQAAIAGITSSGVNIDCTQGDTSFFTSLTDRDVADFIKTNVPNAKFL